MTAPDRIKEIEERLAREYRYERFLVPRPHVQMCEDIAFLLSRVKDLEAERDALKRRLDGIPHIGPGRP